MTGERIILESDDIPHRGNELVRHLARYAVVRTIVSGKRVLDIGCGQGHGARLLRDWGAREVVGVDLLPAAVAAARRAFGGDGISFLTGDAEELDKVLDGAEPFDLVLCFDILEFLARPERFFASLPGLLSAGGAIAVSCSSDYAHGTEARDPLRLGRHSFEAFQALAETHLGKASAWMLGAPLLGEMNFLSKDGAVQEGLGLLETALLVPAPYDGAPDPQSCSHYIGLWGATVAPSAVVTAQSVAASHEPWAMVERLQKRVIDFEEIVATRYEPAVTRLSANEPVLRRQEEEIRSLTAERDALLSENMKLCTRIGEVLEPEIAALTIKLRVFEQDTVRLSRGKEKLETQKSLTDAQVRQLSDEAEALRDAHMQALIANEALEARLQVAEAARLEYETELALLRANVEHATFEKEVQLLRSRLMVHAERSRRAAESIAVLQRKLRETEDMHHSWFMPEIERLNRIVADYETTKRDWWDPQLELKAARIRELERDCREWFEPELVKRDARIVELENQLRSS